jgi:hypothetical protein
MRMCVCMCVHMHMCTCPIKWGVSLYADEYLGGIDDSNNIKPVVPSVSRLTILKGTLHNASP